MLNNIRKQIILTEYDLKIYNAEFKLYEVENEINNLELRSKRLTQRFLTLLSQFDEYTKNMQDNAIEQLSDVHEKLLMNIHNEKQELLKKKRNAELQLDKLLTEKREV